jgi:hypothetical protein
MKKQITRVQSRMPVVVELSVMNAKARLLEVKVPMRVKQSAPIERQGRMTAVGKFTGRFQGAAALIRGLSSRARVLPIEDLRGNREKNGGTIAAALKDPETKKAIELCLLVSWHN